MKHILAGVILLSSLFGSGQNSENVDAPAFKKLIDEKRSVLIDLRTTSEIERKGMIKDALQIDFLAKNSEEVIKKLDRKKSYLIYCAGGGRSGECGGLMQALGFAHVVNLEKGFDDWKAKGFEVVKK